MSDELGGDLFAASVRDPSSVEHRLVYADWLEDRGDRRAAFVREHFALAPLPPDHLERFPREETLSALRVGLDAEWLAVIEPERPRSESELAWAGGMFEMEASGDPDEPLVFKPTQLRRQPQDTECVAWKRLIELIENAAATRRRWLDLPAELSVEDYPKIITLPPSIAKLTALEHLRIGNSNLVRLPRELGALSALTRLDTYHSYRLHWYPYELLRCTHLRSTLVSIRALYGNSKTKPPFPDLTTSYPPVMRPCSVCDREFEDRREHRLWISLVVGSDVHPLLVNACSEACVAALPTPVR